MGCLFELFLEIVVEVVCEVVAEFYLELMSLIVPNKIITPKTKKIITLIVISLSIVLFIALICGAVLWGQDNNLVLRIVGKYMTLISVGIIVIQITLGVIFKIVQNIRRKS